MNVNSSLWPRHFPDLNLTQAELTVVDFEMMLNQKKKLTVKIMFILDSSLPLTETLCQTAINNNKCIIQCFAMN